jgi:hypothetical protein
MALPAAAIGSDRLGPVSSLEAFHGFDFDNTMLRIGSMNML